MRVVAGLCAVDLRSSHQFEDEIGAASSENGFFIPKTEFSVRTGIATLETNPKRHEKCVLFRAMNVITMVIAKSLWMIPKFQKEFDT